MLDGVHGRGGAAGGTDLLVDVLDVIVGGLASNIDPGSDLFGKQPMGEVPEYLRLSGREVRAGPVGQDSMVAARFEDRAPPPVARAARLLSPATGRRSPQLRCVPRAMSAPARSEDVGGSQQLSHQVLDSGPVEATAAVEARVGTRDYAVPVVT